MVCRHLSPSRSHLEYMEYVILNNCMIHREQLACKELSVHITDILQQVVTMVNYIKPHLMHARLFLKLCTDFIDFIADFIDFLCDQQKMCLLAYVMDRIFGKKRTQHKHAGKKTRMSCRWVIVLMDSGGNSYWIESLSKANFTPFPQMSQFLKDNNIDKCSTKEMCGHLKHLEKHFTTYVQYMDMSVCSRRATALLSAWTSCDRAIPANTPNLCNMFG